MEESHLIVEANSLKAKAGLAFDEAVTNLLEQLQEEGGIDSFESPINFSHEGYTYAYQYKADYLIKTNDGEIIVVRTTNSYKQDRIKTQFYDLAGIVNHGQIGKRLIASIYLVGGDQNDSFDRFRERIVSGEIYSPATHLFYLEEFVDFLNEFKLRKDFQSDNELFELEIESRLNDAASVGSAYGKAGNKLEKIVSDLLSDAEQLKLIKKDPPLCHPQYSNIIQAISNGESIDIDSILAVKATNQITLLKSGGNAKTDVKVSLYLDDSEIRVATLSVKNTTASSVSCHDYPSSAFIRVLDCEGTRLAEYLNLFQRFPSISSLKKNLPPDWSFEEFVMMLGEYRTVLTEWATTGQHDTEVIVDPLIQVSKYLFINNPATNESACYLYADYLNLLEERKPNSFGMSLSWTYPSKRKGKRIQLKLPIIL